MQRKTIKEIVDEAKRYGDSFKEHMDSIKNTAETHGQVLYIFDYDFGDIVYLK